jgi:hypothetical protein
VPAIVAASVGGAALAGGVVFLVMRSSKQSDASDQLDELEKASGQSPCGKGTTHTTECAEIKGLSDDAATFGTVSIVSFGVAAGAGVATFLLWPSSSGATGWSSTRPSVAASHDGFYASVAGRF